MIINMTNYTREGLMVIELLVNREYPKLLNTQAQAPSNLLT